MSNVRPPTEEVVKALLDYLVDPMLPLKPSSKNPPSLSNQQSVAKQVLFFFPSSFCKCAWCLFLSFNNNKNSTTNNNLSLYPTIFGIGYVEQ